MSRAKERPICRKSLLHLHPNPTPHTWDGETALDGDGTIVKLTDGQKKQMRKMLSEGYWGEPFQHRRRSAETVTEREKRLQSLCDGMKLLDDARPVAANSGEKLIRVEHLWPLSSTGEHEWSDELWERIPIEKPPFHHVPAWVFEPQNPVSATARMAFAYLCNRGLLNPHSDKKAVELMASQNDIRNVLSIPLYAAQRALNELEVLKIISIFRTALHRQHRAVYSNVIRYIDDPGRWTRIKAAQTSS